MKHDRIPTSFGVVVSNGFAFIVLAMLAVVVVLSLKELNDWLERVNRAVVIIESGAK